MVWRIPRWLARAPIPLYHRGLGRLLGPRMAMLEHKGRRTGLLRYAVLEVLEHDSSSLVVVSGYGPRSEWFRNIRADPAVRVWTGSVRAASAHASPVASEDTHEILEQYRRRRPRAAAALGRLLNLPDLRRAGPLEPDVGNRLPLVRVEYAPQHR